MENNNLTSIKKDFFNQINYISAAWNALNYYAENIEIKNKNLEIKNKNLEEENKVLKADKNLMAEKIEELTQLLNKFVNKDDVKTRNIFEEIETPENISANTSTSIELDLQNNLNSSAGSSSQILAVESLNFKKLHALFPVPPLPRRIKEKSIWDEDDDEENCEDLEEENEDCW
ncbi:hypothetical protein ACQ4LE_006882 [Meloidogyne hapla]|uniref:Uncharacterized protein n=1 Tax=Meloidogyne hapla TaxID=6305 RepID=A0A1I8BI03_MELHA